MKKAKNNPAISVIMPVYNSEKYILQAVDSILKQSFSDFEFFIVDDASNDNTLKTLDTINDSRIIIINNDKQKGHYKCRNQALPMVKGKYVAVMDGDDIAHTDRFMKQFDFLENNRQFMATGSCIELFSDQDKEIKPFKRLTNKDQINVFLLKDNVCTHPTLFIRSEIFNKHNIRYSEEYYFSADYDLVSEINKIGSITNMPDFLLMYRNHPNQISSYGNKDQVRYADYIRLKQLSVFNLRPSPLEIMLHLDLMKENSISKQNIITAKKWVKKLINKNNKLKIFESKYLDIFLDFYIYIAEQKAF